MVMPLPPTMPLATFGGLACQLVQHAEVVVRYRLVGHESRHLLELLDGVLVIAVLLIDNSQVEPRMGYFRVLLLGLEQFRDSFLGLAGTQKGDAVIHPLTRGIGRHVERLLELDDGFLLRSGVLVEGFTEVAVAPEKILLLARRAGAVQQQQYGGRQYDAGNTPKDPFHGWRCPHIMQLVEAATNSRFVLGARSYCPTTQ